MTNPLGRQVPHSDVFDPSLLFAIPRSQARVPLGIKDPPPFVGVDRWTCYELAWLDPNGLPVLGIATLEYPADSPMLVESKSLKLFLGSMNFTRFGGVVEVTAAIQDALRPLLGADPISVSIKTVSEWGSIEVTNPVGECIDEGSAEMHHTVRLKTGDEGVEETLHSNLLRSLCPVTGQPDWGTVMIRYRGRKIDRASLRGYLLMHRSYQGFHEECCERIFVDVAAACNPTDLWVGCSYTRRGGVDINPERWLPGSERVILRGRLPRQ
jgi:7-cyano-7-deazaguanine reductase